MPKKEQDVILDVKIVSVGQTDGVFLFLKERTHFFQVVPFKGYLWMDLMSAHELGFLPDDYQKQATHVLEAWMKQCIIGQKLEVISYISSKLTPELQEEYQRLIILARKAMEAKIRLSGSPSHNTIDLLDSCVKMIQKVNGQDAIESKMDIMLNVVLSLFGNTMDVDIDNVNIREINSFIESFNRFLITLFLYKGFSHSYAFPHFLQGFDFNNHQMVSTIPSSLPPRLIWSITYPAIIEIDEQGKTRKLIQKARVITTK